VPGGDGDVDPINVGDDADEEEKAEDSPTNASGLSGMGWREGHEVG